MESIKRKRTKAVIINILITLVVAALYFYFKLPAINLHNPDFYWFVILLAVVYCLATAISAGILKEHDKSGVKRVLRNHCFPPLIVCGVLLVLFILGSLISSVIFRSGSYTQLLTVEDADFLEDVTEISFDQIPMLDADSAEKLGDRKLGELADMVSQFEVSSSYTQINYNGVPIRVTPLEYGDIIKWFNNRKEGLPAYIVIDMVTQNVEVVRLSEGMKYSMSDKFGRYLMRHLRMNYPTYMFDTPVFEIDESGTPYWVCPKLEKTIGLFGGTDINGAVLVNAITGECTYYDAESVPSWVDRVYSAELIIEQYDYYGEYSNGFFNSIFGQKGVTVTTDGYNYIALNDDVYMYTGITSVGGDESNVGFILSNQRTKETKYYAIAGAEEYSAMDSAKGIVQHLGYSATFPLLLNIHSQPTYFMALKDAAGLVKMYAMVNVQQYQIVANGTTVAECEDSYRKLLAQHNLLDESGGSVPETVEIIGVIEDIRWAVIDGNSWAYVKLEDSGVYYALSAAENREAVILDVGRLVRLRVPREAEADIVDAELVVR